MSGGGANGDTLSADQLDNLDEMMLREAQVHIHVYVNISRDYHMTVT